MVPSLLRHHPPCPWCPFDVGARPFSILGQSPQHRGQFQQYGRVAGLQWPGGFQHGDERKKRRGVVSRQGVWGEAWQAHHCHQCCQSRQHIQLKRMAMPTRHLVHQWEMRAQKPNTMAVPLPYAWTKIPEKMRITHLTIWSGLQTMLAGNTLSKDSILALMLFATILENNMTSASKVAAGKSYLYTYHQLHSTDQTPCPPFHHNSPFLCGWCDNLLPW